MKNIKAKTNSFDIKENKDDIINKLLLNNNLKKYHIQQASILFKGDYKELNIKINSEINNILGTNKKNIYDFFIHNKIAYFFFLSDYCQNTKSINISNIISNTNSKKNIITALININVKKYLLENSLRYNNIKVEDLNENLLFCRQDTKIAINYLKFKGYFSNENRYSFIFNRFSIQKDIIQPAVNFDDLKINLENKKEIHKKLDARKYNKLNFINFYSKKDENTYENSINFYQNYIHLIIKNIFEEKSIKYEEVVFEKDKEIENFIQMESLSKISKIKIIDNYVYSDEELKLKNLFYKKLIENINLLYNKDLNSTSIINEISLSDIIKPLEYNNLEKDFSYIVVNKSEDSTSIKSQEKKYQNFSDVLISIDEKNKIEDFDYYTQLKYNNYINENKIITQGLNIESIQEFFKQCDKNIQKNHKKQETLNKASIKLNKSPEQIKNETFPLIKKIITELQFKNSLFRDKKIINVDLEDSNISLIYIKNNNYNNNKINRIIEANIEIKDKIIYINDNKIYNSYQDFYLQSLNIDIIDDINDENLLQEYFEQGQSGTLFIVDKDKKSILYTYTSITRPNIIGNFYFNNYEKHIKDKLSINRSTLYEKNILPYYMMPKTLSKKNLIYIQKISDKSINYFVSENAPTNSSISKQNLIYTLNVEGKDINLNDKLINLFLKSFTFNILKINESSNSSIFDKIIRELLFEN